MGTEFYIEDHDYYLFSSIYKKEPFYEFRGEVEIESTNREKKKHKAKTKKA